MFGTHFGVILRHYEFIQAEIRPHVKNQRVSFVILKDLPTNEEYQKLLKKHYTTTAGSLISDAYSELECLKDELQDWYDNLPPQFQDGDKGSILQDSISSLENFSEPDVPKFAEELPVFYLPALGINSRASRCSEASNMLQAALDACEEKIAYLDINWSDMPGLTQEKAEEYSAELQELVDSLGEIIGETDGIEFPGMFS